MARVRVELGPEVYAAAAAAPAVRAQLQERRDAVLSRARRIATAEGATQFARSLRTEGGTRPGTKSAKGIRRPYERVIATSADAVSREYGDRNVKKAAIMRRAAGA